MIKRDEKGNSTVEAHLSNWQKEKTILMDRSVAFGSYRFSNTFRIHRSLLICDSGYCTPNSAIGECSWRRRARKTAKSAPRFTCLLYIYGDSQVRSVTLVDPVSSTSGALPICVLEYPVVREVVLGFSLAFAKIVNMCCSKRIRVADADAQRLLLKGRDGEKAVVAIGKKLNYSFDIAEWGGSENLKAVPMQVLWSSGWSKEWSDEGNRVARALPLANFVTHSGGRWPQEDAPDEIAEKISEFILSLPKSVRKVEEEPIPEHIQKMFDEAKSGDHDHIHHHHHHHDHDHHIDAHVHGAEYMDAYGLGEGHHHGL